MPVANRSQPAQLTFPTGSILSTAVPASSLREERVKLCIYGRNRSGKTTLACKFAKPILIISTEPDANGGATSVSDVPDVTVARVSAARLCGDHVSGSVKLVGIAAELAVNNPFETVVFDTITSFQDIVLTEIMGWQKVPEMLTFAGVPDGTYTIRAEKIREAVRPLLNLTNCNVIVLAQEKDHNAQEDRSGKSKVLHTMQQGSFMAPALGATNAQWLQDHCGYVVQIYEDEVTQEVRIPMNDAQGNALEPAVQRVGTGRRQRHLRLLYHPNFAAGGRWQYDPSMPEFVTAPDPSGLYAAMARYIPALRV